VKFHQVKKKKKNLTHTHTQAGGSLIITSDASVNSETMKFDLTFLIHPNEKSSFEKPHNFFMEKSHACSVDPSPVVSHSDETEGGCNDHSSILGTSMGTTRSASIPLPSSHVPRTQSEVQLSIDEEAAEQRDARMFDRLVNGIRVRQQQQQSSIMHSNRHWDNSLEQSLSRIAQARLAPLSESVRSVDHNDEPPVEIVAQYHHEFPHEASDAWSISGYDNEEQYDTFNEQDNVEDEDNIQDDGGLFEMDF
jgi:hypothetical protein